MKMKKEINKELKGLNSSLVEYDKNTIYDVPEDYFNRMQEKVFDKIEKEGTKAKIIVLGSYRWILGVAALLFIVFGGFLMDSNIQKDDEVSLEATYNYLSENIDEFDEVSLVLMLADDELPLDDDLYFSTDLINEYLDESIDDLNEEEIEQYF